jgi:hypothetical protein
MGECCRHYFFQRLSTKIAGNVIKQNLLVLPGGISLLLAVDDFYTT